MFLDPLSCTVPLAVGLDRVVGDDYDVSGIQFSDTPCGGVHHRLAADGIDCRLFEDVEPEDISVVTVVDIGSCRHNTGGDGSHVLAEAEPRVGRFDRRLYQVEVCLEVMSSFGLRSALPAVVKLYSSVQR